MSEETIREDVRQAVVENELAEREARRNEAQPGYARGLWLSWVNKWNEQG